MADESREDKKLLPKPNISRKLIAKHFRKVETATVKHAHKFIIKRWSNVREVRGKVILWFVTMGVLIAATGFQMMWYQKSYLTESNSIDGTYVEAVIGPFDSLNPIFANTNAEKSASYLLFSSLLRYDKSGKLNKDLAKSINYTEDNTYLVKIKSNAKWHDSKKLTAEDVVFTVNLLKNPIVNSNITGWSAISAEVVDELTVRFKLPSTYAAFEHMLTFPILPKHILKDVTANNIRENSFSQNPIGSGPFKLRFIQSADVVSDQKNVYMARNDDYYGGKAKLSRIQLNAYGSTQEIIKALRNNEVNATTELLQPEIKQLTNEKYKVISKSTQSAVYAILNTKSPVVNDINVRKALRYSTNTKALIEKLPEQTNLIDLPFTDGQISGDIPNVQSYDIELAKKTLDEAGWVMTENVRKKGDTVLKISAVATVGSEFESVLGVLAGQWRAVGFEVETQIVDPTNVTQNVVQNILQPRSFDILIYKLEIGADPDVYAYWHSSQTTSKGLNYANYSNIISDNALDSARSRIETDLRNAKYITFAKQWINDIPAIGLYQSSIQYVYSGNLNTVDESTKLITSVDRFSDVLNWSIGSQTVYKTP